MRSLKDVQEYYDYDNIAADLGIFESQWSLFGIIWPSSFILASIMEAKVMSGQKVLEIGCGLALSSLLLKLKGVNITATDYHPEVAAFLKENIRINECEKIPFFQADWEDFHEKADNRFDLIIGSDLLYQRDHPENLAHFINKNAHEACQVIIVDPKRGNRSKFSQEMEKFRFKERRERPDFLDRYKEEYKGTVSYFTR